nr:rab escort protein 1 [Quercus suber]
MDSLLTLPKSSHSESSTTVHSEKSAEVKPAVLWKALYIQELTMDQFESINSTAMPDGNFNYNNILDAALKLSSHRSNLLRNSLT